MDTCSLSWLVIIGSLLSVDAQSNPPPVTLIPLMTFPLFARKNITSTEALANSSNLTSPETAATESTSTGVVIPTELEEGDYSKTTLQDDEHLHFNQSEYNVTATTKQIGLLYQFTVVTPHSDQVVFGIDTNDVQVNETFRMGPATGLLYADQGLTAGHYHFNVTAEIFSTQEHAESKVNVIVTDKLSATMGVLRVCNSSQVYNLREENFKGVTLQPPCTLDSSLKCSLSMVDQTPGGDFFQFDKDNGTLRAVRRIDREDAMFASSATPASITVTLDVTCLPLAAEPTHHCIPHHALYSSVHSSQRITMKIEIEDVNDNWPLFSVDRLVVGYPFRDVAKEILPPSIVNVKAHDKDVGENALIRYSIMPSEHSAQVTIHARTGSVYPTVAFRYTDFVFTVLAQDRDGQKGCNNATLHVQVIMLYRHEISVVYVENSVTEDAAEVMHQLRNASDYTFYVLDAGVVSDVTAAQADVTGSDTVLRAVVYALDTDNNVVSHIDMHAALSRTALIKTVTALPSVSARKDLVTMATAVIILSVIVAALLVFFAITVYVVYIRPRRFGVFITPTSELDPSTQKLLENMDQGSLNAEPMVTNEMERIAINVRDTDHNMECQQKSESGSSERTTTTELPAFVPLQRAHNATNTHTSTLSPRADKKSPKPRKRSQPVRGDLIPDPDKLLSYKKHEGHKRQEEQLEDPTVPGGVKPREPRMPEDEPAERKKSTVTFSTVVETIDE